MLKMQTFLRNRDDQIDRYGNPDLRPHGVLASANKCLDAQMLFDPFEEQPDLPSLAIQVGNQLGLPGEVVRQKRDALSRVVFDHQRAQCC